MFSITEQFSAATKSQLETQLKFINTFASKAVESAGKVIALNISTTKATVETSSAAAKKLLEAKDPQEFFKLSNNQQPSFDKLIAYSRELYSIASSTQEALIQSAKEQIKNVPALAATPAPAKAAAPVAAAKPVAAKPAAAPVVTPAAAPVVAAAPAAPANEPVAAPVAAKPEVKAEVKAEAKVEASKAVAKVEAREEAKPQPAAKPAASFPAVPPKPPAAAATAAVSKPVAVALKSVPAKDKSADKAAPTKQLDMLSGSGKSKK